MTLAPSGFPEGYTQLIADAEQRLVAATRITVAVASLALRAARAQIADPQTTRRDRARALAYDLGLKAIEEEIAGLEQSNGGPLTAQQQAELEHPHSTA